MFAQPRIDDATHSRGYGVATHGTDRNLFVEFYRDKVLNAAKTEATGDFVYDDVVMIRIQTPGDVKTVHVQPAKLEKTSIRDVTDPERFPHQWNAFTKGEEQLQNGTPIEALGLGRSEMTQLKQSYVLTVEALAELPEFALDNIGLGARALRKAAQKWLEQQKTIDKRDVTALQEENAALRAENADFKQKLANLMERMSAVEEVAPPKRGPGRPRKENHDDSQ